MLFRVNSPQVTHQTLDGETIILNLESGIYYSAGSCAALIWEGITQGVAAHEIAAQLERRYCGNPETFSAAIEAFLGELQQESLIVPQSNGAQAAAWPDHLDALFPVPTTASLFELPILQKYTDMQDLLLLDPIHEVDEAGWPLEKSDQNH